MTGERLFDDAVQNGVDNKAIMITVSELLDKLNSNEVTKNVFKEAIEIIVLLKGKVDSKTDIQFSSDYLTINGSKLVSAFEKGLTALEISESINNVDSTLKNDIVAFVSLMKEKESKLKEKESADSFQKILTNPNENV